MVKQRETAKEGVCGDTVMGGQVNVTKKLRCFLRSLQPFPYSLTTQGLYMLERTDMAL